MTRRHIVIRCFVLGAVLGTLGSLVVMHDRSDAAGDAEPIYTFVSSPDLWNQDVGDLRQLDTWQAGDGNSTSPQVRTSVGTILDTFAAEQPDDVLVAGDLVEGHWGADVESTRLFGPVSTLEQRQAQIRRAGAFYYGEWAERFANRGLTVHAAVGDHEIGDNPWSGTASAYGAGNTFKRRSFGVYKDTWADVFTAGRYANQPAGTAVDDTAYAVYLHPEVLLVTVDVFRRVNGDVHTRLGPGQLAWLDNTLAASTADTVIVQGHTPVLGPVRQTHSSGLMYEGGMDSAFWRTLVKHDVDLYLCGEVHTVTTLVNQGVTQISHGGLINRSGVNYLRGDVYADGTVELELNRFSATIDDSAAAPLLWATTWKRPFADVVYADQTTVTGTMTVGQTSTGELQPPS